MHNSDEDANSVCSTHENLMTSNQTKSSTEEGLGYKVPPLNQEAVCIDTYRERENQFSPMEYHCIYQLESSHMCRPQALE